MRQPALSRARRALVALVAVVTATLGLVITPPAYAATTVSGHVTLTTGGPAPAGTRVMARPAGGGAAIASTVIDPADGGYQLAVGAPSVDLAVNAPDGSGWGQTVVAGVDTSTDRTVDVQLAPAEAVTITGVVRDGKDRVLPNTYVQIGTRSATTDSTGTYTLTLAPGTHVLGLDRTATATHGSLSISGSVELTTSRTLDITVPTHEVQFRVVGPSGNPVPNTRIVANTPTSYLPLDIGEGINTSYYNSSSPYDLRTNTQGVATINLLGSDRPQDNYAFPPAESALVDTAYILPAITSDTTVDIAATRGVTITGVVRDGKDRVLPNTYVQIGTRSATTDSTGAYTLTVAPGTHVLGLDRTATATHGSLSISGSVELTTSRTLDITVPTHEVQFRVVGPSGNPVPNTRIVANTPTSYLPLDIGEGINTSYYNSSSPYDLRTNTQGVATINLLGSDRPQDNYAFPPAESALVDTAYTLPAITSDTTVDIAATRGVTITGVVRDGKDRVLPNTYVQIGTRSATTDSTGAYTLTVAPGTHVLGLDRTATATHGSLSIFGSVELTTSRTLDITVPTHEVQFRVVGPSGNPVPNTRIVANTPTSYLPLDIGEGINTSYYNSSSPYDLRTNTQGVATINLLGSDRPQDNYAYAPSVTTLPDTVYTLPSLRSDRTLVISFSKSAVDQVSPTVTCGTLPHAWRSTNASVTCTASDTGTGLRNPDDASFTISTAVADGDEDGNATAGPRQVCDLADNCTDAVATGAKADRKAPVVLFTPESGATVTAGSDLTLMYGCVDGGSGTATCAGDVPSETRLPTGTLGDHHVTVTTIDVVGNAGTATFDYTVTAAPVPPVTGDQVDDQLTYLRGEEYLSIPAGQTLTRTVGCGGVLVDASPVVLHVDQGSSYADVHVLSADRDGTGAMAFTVVNDTDGQAQVKLLATCLASSTSAGGQVSIASTPAEPLVDGEPTEVSCPAGSRGVAPSWDLDGATLDQATPSADGRTWTFTAAGGSGQVGLACLRTTTAGGTQLVFGTLTATVTGGDEPGSTSLSAPDRFSILTAGWSNGDGATYLGHELQDRQAVLRAAGGTTTVTLLTVRGYTQALQATAPLLKVTKKGVTVTTRVTCRATACSGPAVLTGTSNGRIVRLATTRVSMVTGTTRAVTFTVALKNRALTRGALVLTLAGHRAALHG